MNSILKQNNSLKKLKSEWESLVVKGLRGSGIDDITKKTDDHIIRGPL